MTELSSAHPPTDRSPHARISALLSQLCEGLYDREEAVRLALLASVAGESIFLLGPPGVGKSLVARRLKHAFSSGRAFEYLMSRFSTPDEIFGPVSIRKLREEDRYERRIEGYLPGSDVIFLDEIWKAGPAIQNALLTVLNERIYRNGDQDVKVAVRAILTASNELPPAGESLSPLWDRFLLRYEVDNIRAARSFLSMITDTRDVYTDNVDPDLKLDAATLDAWSSQIDAVELPPEVLNVVQVVRQRIDRANETGAMPRGPLKLYDRRWKKLVRLLRTSAFLNDRAAVNLMDCALLVHGLWSHPEQRELLDELVRETVRKHGYSLATGLAPIRAEAAELEADIRAETEVVHTVTEQQPLVVDADQHRLLPTDDRFTATRMKASDYARLRSDDPIVVAFNDDKGNLRHRIRAWRAPISHTIRVELRGTQLDIPVETRLVERPERIRRTPHRLLVDHWTRRLERIEAEVHACRARLEELSPEVAARSEANVFVDDAFQRVVRANHEQVVQGFHRVALQLEKARHRLAPTP